MFSRTLTIVDTETTGGSPLTSRVIEIGILRVEHGEISQKYKSLINPGQPIPEFITEFTGITDKKVKNAPYFEEIAEDVLALFEGSVLVAHNSNFDYKFLKSEFERLGFGFTMPSLCTVRLSRALFPQHKRHNLSAIIERFGLACKNRHRAYDDAKAVWDFLQLLPEQFPKEQLAQTFERTLKGIPPKKQQRMKAEDALEYVGDEDMVFRGNQDFAEQTW